MIACVILLLLLLPPTLLPVLLETLYSTEELLARGVSLENPWGTERYTEDQSGSLPSGTLHHPRLTRSQNVPTGKT